MFSAICRQIIEQIIILLLSRLIIWLCQYGKTRTSFSLYSYSWLVSHFANRIDKMVRFGTERNELNEMTHERPELILQSVLHAKNTCIMIAWQINELIVLMESTMIILTKFEEIETENEPATENIKGNDLNEVNIKF